MNKLILVPTDFSENANAAAKYALYIAGRLNCDLLLFHSVTYSEATEDGEIHSLKEVEEDAVNQMRSLQTYLQRVLEKDGGGHIDIGAEQVVGFATDTILDAIEKHEPQLVVMGTQGATGLGKLLGSNAAHIMKNSASPTLLVPADAEVNPIDNIVYATDFDDKDVTLAPMLHEWAINFNATVHFVHVTDYELKQEENKMAELEAKMAELGKDVKDVYAIIEHSDMSEGLHEYMDDSDSDLLVMLTHKRNLLQRIFNKSETAEMAYEAKYPLLIVHA